jgi:hypothetical protein
MTTIVTAGDIAALRERLNRYKDFLTQAQTRLEQTDEHKNLEQCKRNIAEIAGELSQLEVDYKQQCLQRFEQTDERSYPGAKVRTYEIVEFTDIDAIKHSIKNNYTVCLSLKKANFNKIIKAEITKAQAAGETLPDFVTLSQEERVSLASDMSEYLPTTTNQKEN